MNKVFLIGNLTRDPELTETSGGIKVCRFCIAVSRKYSNAGGERQTDFFNCVAWRGLGENVAEYAKKGSKVAVSGSIELRNYEDGQGVKRTAIDIIAQDVEFFNSEKFGLGRRLYPFRTEKLKPRLQPFDDDIDIPF